MIMELQFAEQASSASERMSQNAGGILIIQNHFKHTDVFYCPYCILLSLCDGLR